MQENCSNWWPALIALLGRLNAPGYDTTVAETLFRSFRVWSGDVQI